jgi:type II secretory pathway pseudopilin PulG
MSISFTCPHCGKQMLVDDQYAGQTGPCSSCGKTITIPPPTKPAYGAAPVASGAGASIAVILGVVAVSILVCGGILAALLFPALNSARAAAKRSQSTNNVKQLALALHNYHDVYGSFPPAVVKDDDGNPLYSGRVLLLPFIEQQNVFQAFDKTKAWNAPENAPFAQMRIPVFEDPAGPTTGAPRTDYLFVTGPGTVFEDGKRVSFAQITDGSSNTMWIIETAGSNAHWAEPKDLDVSQLNALPPGNHAGGNIVGMADGSVRFMSNGVNPATFKALQTRDGGEPVDSNF